MTHWGPPLILLLGGLWLHPAQGGSHSFRAFVSFVSGPLPGVPQFSMVGYLNDIPITGYTSESRILEPLTPLVEKFAAEEPQFWEAQRGFLRLNEQALEADARIVMDQLNQSSGLHMFQVMSGCKLREDGSIGGIFQYAFDGHKFLSFDKDRLSFTAAMDLAKTTQDRWNSGRILALYWKSFIESRCIEYLQKYLKKKEEILQTVAPQTLVSRRKKGDRTFLIGYAYGFYPREIEVKWVRNGVDLPLESRQILPNPDGTYQVRATVEVQEGDDEKTYKYEVDHISLPEIVTVVYEEKSPPMGVIIGGIVGAIVVVVLITAVIVYSKKKTSGKAGYTGANQDPTPTDSSSSQCSA